MGSKVLSDGTTEVSFDGESINIIREGDFEGETIPVNLWDELKQAVDDLILDQG